MGVGLTPSSALSPQSVAKVRILVTDDQPEMLLLIDRALGDTYECEFATDLREAHEKLAEEDYLVEPFWPGQPLIAVMSALRRRSLEAAAEIHARNEEDRHQTIIDMAPVGIYAKDRSATYIVANDKANELAGVDSDGLMGLTERKDTAEIGGTVAAAQQKSIDELQLSRQETIEGLVKAIELHDFPTGGRITAVADVFDALLSDRASGSGSQFDPNVIEILLDNLDECLWLREAFTPMARG